MAVPVRAIDGAILAAMDMTAHSSMISLEALVDDLSPHLVATADRLSAQLGYRREHETSTGRGEA